MPVPKSTGVAPGVLSANRTLNPAEDDKKRTVTKVVEVFMRTINSTYKLSKAQMDEIIKLLDQTSEISVEKRYSQPRVLSVLAKMNIIELRLGGEAEEGWYQLCDEDGQPVLNRGTTPIFLTAGSAIHGASMSMAVVFADNEAEEL